MHGKYKSTSRHRHDLGSHLPVPEGIKENICQVLWATFSWLPIFPCRLLAWSKADITPIVKRWCGHLSILLVAKMIVFFTKGSLSHLIFSKAPQAVPVSKFPAWCLETLRPIFFGENIKILAWFKVILRWFKGVFFITKVLRFRRPSPYYVVVSHVTGWNIKTKVCYKIWRFPPNTKMTGETPEVRSDKRKPREDRQNHRYHRYYGYHKYHGSHR